MGIQLPKKGARQPLNFRTVSIVAKRSPISATAELLLSSVFNSGIFTTCGIIINNNNNNNDVLFQV